ncbi:MAG: hypothetical protein ACYCQI_00065 [Gammaproteobacteria bacterium]
MIGDREQQARYQSIFYRDSYHKILKALIYSSFFILILIATTIYLILFQAPTHYYATTLGGQIIPMLPVS